MGRGGLGVAPQQAEMGVVRWMCGIGLQYGVPGGGLRERLGLGDVFVL